MRAGLITILIISAALISATTVYARENTTNSAVAVMKDAKGNTVGLATFTEECDGLVRINVNVKCLTPGMHGIHIHEKGNCTGPDFASAGGHYNPLGKEHGLNNPKGPHAGDLPNLKVGKDGRGQMNVTTDLVTLSPGPTTLFSANGTALIIHSDPDDQMTNPSGNSGARIACGVIEKK
ncbi:MAG: superoxide dismutase family protein [Methanosarcina thermophila]|jgi:Cu-Zn family superoxide dismutase|uniref:Superoxide dismutase n=3 Tax=Methanosarcina thermophila TaxID=2210 RepID=A0A1I7A724_METTE|nr:superoxide dismutase family protein [Methanosarcina thermophila]AKB11814.1 Superoxide dismutase [Cu-Zn] precursor [Methanosarcina thermophila TM-1]ALK05544.1 MAG: superoxide dismutase [Methanosarcina sp. 795]AKB14992.1 Superoxide dismutase [Cu-Zn] precursor [Methanosarcina thermophila CHTI-55]NLU57508.1 superoxide dismutase family protein [Methanosarcina thermophila]SFT70680.1 superoxide dismutase, Cu-Zn family [Methanosarcina thermophila]